MRMLLENGYCYENSETKDGQNVVIGPLKRNCFLFSDEKGFPFFENGEFLNLSTVCWNIGKEKPEKNLVRKVKCDSKRCDSMNCAMKGK